MKRHSITINHDVLTALCRRNCYPVDESSNRIYFFGIRGALPEFLEKEDLDFSGGYRFEKEHRIVLKPVNYYHPRCTLGQWQPSTQKLAIFPGSTVPNLGWIYLKRRAKDSFNLLMQGCYSYVKGVHPANKSRFQPHPAFRMQGSGLVKLVNFHLIGSKPILDFHSDTVEVKVMTPRNNIHAATNIPNRTKIKALQGAPYSFRFVLSDLFHSLGCQVIVGNPEQYLPSNHQGQKWNAWQAFHDNAYLKYASNQKQFKYFLFEGTAIKNTAIIEPDSVQLKFGSAGDWVIQLQRRLQQLHHLLDGTPLYQGIIDGLYGSKTTHAIIQFQKQYFGRSNGMVDPQTIRALNLKLSKPIFTKKHFDENKNCKEINSDLKYSSISILN